MTVLRIEKPTNIQGGRTGKNGDTNKLSEDDRPAHGWYRFVLSYPPHVVRHYLNEFGMKRGSCVLDPFCGTGTTIVECRKHGVNSIGIEANPMAFFASSVKVDWSLDSDRLLKHAESVAREAARCLQRDGIDDYLGIVATKGSSRKLRTLPPESMALLLTNSISPLPLHKTLVLLDHMRRMHDRNFAHEQVALARALVFSISNLHFGPEVGVGKLKADTPVIAPWLEAIHEMVGDIRSLSEVPTATADLHCADARDLTHIVSPHCVDAVITSPPYPNEKDYTRTTRLESVLLGFLNNKVDLKQLKNNLMRSNTRNVYKGDTDDVWVRDHKEIQRIADEIERRRIEMGKTSGFERMYAKVTRQYFGGMARHLSEMRSVLRPGANLAYVVGDQASYLRVLIRTGELLADIAKSLGYEIVRIDLFRTRLATATREQLREEVVVLRWPGFRNAPKMITKGMKSNGKRQSLRRDY